MMKKIAFLLLIIFGLSGCNLFKKDKILIHDPAAEAIKSINLNLDPLPPMDLEEYQPKSPPEHIKKPGTKFEVDIDWLEKNEKLLIELQSRIYLHQERDKLNKELFEKAKKLGDKEKK